MKLLQDNKKLQSDEFSNATPYVIMFGPDKCGATNKVMRIRRLRLSIKQDRKLMRVDVRTGSLYLQS